MRVQLYIYDLSNGLARTISQSLLGFQLDMIYHTSIIMEGIEYVYDGGVKTVDPGGTHLGRPLQVMDLGTTNLPMDVIMDYLESLRDVYTAETYDLWSHNCNNFSNDFATFLLGKGIPDHIINQPDVVLSSPMGRMLVPHLNKMVEKRQNKNGGLLGIQNTAEAPETSQRRASTIRTVTSLVETERLLKGAEKSCAVIFFTSEKCAPCKPLYPIYQELAAEAAHKATLMMVDVTRSYEIATRFAISSTPTFITFLHGIEENRWSGADAAKLRGSILQLTAMAWPPHTHEALTLPVLRSSDMKPVLFSKIPPLGKLKAKMGPASDDAAISGVMHFVSTRAREPSSETTLPDLDAFSRYLRTAPKKVPLEIIFTIVDLMRLALIDPRFSGYYAEEKDHDTIAPLISHVNGIKDCPYNLRLVALQMCCNLFTSPLYPPHILGCPTLAIPIVELVTTSLLDDVHHNVRVAAASLCFNIATANSRMRTEEHSDCLPEEQQVELAASLLEAISEEKESPEALKGFLLAFGYLVYCAPKAGELINLLKSMDAQGTVLSKKKLFPLEGLVVDIGETLLGKGLE